MNKSRGSYIGSATCTLVCKGETTISSSKVPSSLTVKEKGSLLLRGTIVFSIVCSHKYKSSHRFFLGTKTNMDWPHCISSRGFCAAAPPEGHKFNRTLAGCVKWVSDIKLSASMLDKRAHFSSANLINILTATLVSVATGQWAKTALGKCLCFIQIPNTTASNYTI